MSRLSFVGALALALAACGGSGRKPEDLSVEDHEAAAARHESRAESRDGPPLRVDPAGRYRFNAAHARHAEEHRQAAEKLRADEEAACPGLPEAERATCPLMREPVLAVETLPNGVRVTYGGADAGALGRQAECHRAHGAAEGREGMPGCPLYSKALSVRAEAVEGGAVLVLTSDDADTVARLHELYVREPATP